MTQLMYSQVEVVIGIAARPLTVAKLERAVLLFS
jgi:hypothetical protein